jgi:hypothetical protein
MGARLRSDAKLQRPTRMQFHLECVGLKRPPSGRWFCRECIARDGAIVSLSLVCSRPTSLQAYKPRNCVDDLASLYPHVRSTIAPVRVYNSRIASSPSLRRSSASQTGSCARRSPRHGSPLLFDHLGFPISDRPRPWVATSS